MTPPPAGRARRAWLHLSTSARKGLASLAILVCLGAQAYAILRPSGVRFYPFLSYPMYARSRPGGETFRVTELWARTCDERPRAWQVWSRALGYQDNHFLTGLRGTVGDRPSALRYRARLSGLALSHLTPRPCVLQVWERTVPTTRAGVDVSALRHPRRTLLAQWPVGEAVARRASSRGEHP
jgi:hypothetical protein